MYQLTATLKPQTDGGQNLWKGEWNHERTFFFLEWHCWAERHPCQQWSWLGWYSPVEMHSLCRLFMSLRRLPFMLSGPAHTTSDTVVLVLFSHIISHLALQSHSKALPRKSLQGRTNVDYRIEQKKNIISKTNSKLTALSVSQGQWKHPWVRIECCCLPVTWKTTQVNEYIVFTGRKCKNTECFFNHFQNIQVSQVPESSEGIFRSSLQLVALNKPVE